MSQKKCGSPEDKGIMRVSQTLIARRLWSHLVTTDKNSVRKNTMCWRRDPAGGRAALSGQTPLFWLLEISPTECKHRNEVEKQMWTVGGIETSEDPQSL